MDNDDIVSLPTKVGDKIPATDTKILISFQH